MLAPERCVGRVALRVEGRGLWRGTKFTPALPGVTSDGRPRLSGFSLALPGPKEDASGKTFARERLAQVAWERHPLEGGDLRALLPPAALLGGG